MKGKEAGKRTGVQGSASLGGRKYQGEGGVRGMGLGPSPLVGRGQTRSGADTGASAAGKARSGRAQASKRATTHPVGALVHGALVKNSCCEWGGWRKKV